MTILWCGLCGLNPNLIKKSFQVQTAFQALFDYDPTLQTPKTMLFQLVCNLNAERLCITADDVKKAIATLDIDAKGLILCDLSHLELSLVVAIRHHSEIYDRDPFNFEMVFTRLKKFENSSQNVNMKGQCDRASALKAFERLQVK